MSGARAARKVVGIAILSTPVPLRAFRNEPANPFVARFPWIREPAFLVPAALFGQRAAFRKLSRMG